MASITVQQLLTLALKQAGVIGEAQPGTAETLNDALTLTNYMISEWSVQRWVVWHLVEYSYVSTGANSYTVGPGGNFNVPYVPNCIDDAFLRQLNSGPLPVDYAMKIIVAREDYNRIALKQLTSFQRYAFYDYSYENGTGTLYPWPVPLASIYEMHIFCKAQLAQFTGLTQVVNLPPEYASALHHNLVVRFEAAWKLPISQADVKLATTTLNIIKNTNLQMPLLQIPTDLTRNAIYDIYSDQVY